MKGQGEKKVPIALDFPLMTSNPRIEGTSRLRRSAPHAQRLGRLNGHQPDKEQEHDDT